MTADAVDRQPAVIPVAAVRAGDADTLAIIKADIGPDCSRCKLHTLGRKQVVFGVGNPNADLMFVGEAPGADEDIQGEPFVGRAGQLLTKIIEAINLRREDVYIANVIKCRPPQNRNPEPDEVEQCEPFLFRQIDVIKPKVIVALGKFAAQCLLKTTDADHADPRPRVPLPRRHSDADVPPGLPAPEPVQQARGVGGHEARPRAAGRRREPDLTFAPPGPPVRFVAVAVPIPQLDALTYRVPDGVPRRRWARACACRSARGSSPAVWWARPRRRGPASRPRTVQEVLDETPFIPPAVVELCAWVADYYMAGLGDAVAVALPPGAKARASGYKTRRLVALTAHGIARRGRASAGG